MSLVTEKFKLHQLEMMANDIIHRVDMLKECELDKETNFAHIIGSLKATLCLIETEIDSMRANKDD